VIVVFKSSDAPVTGTADVGIAGDWHETLPAFAQAYADGG
jgi:electron transfer flavoprotein alpha subunit